MAALKEDTYGQPTSWTHPHLVNTGELVPGIAMDEFQKRRLRLATGIQKFSRDRKGENMNKPQNHIVSKENLIYKNKLERRSSNGFLYETNS